MQQPILGLTPQEVAERKARGECGSNPESVTKTKAQIFKENILTLFNLLNLMIAIMLFVAGAYSNMLFLAIILLNIAIGIAQEMCIRDRL